MQLVFLHAFPLNGAMWEQQESLSAGRILCPDLYPLGSSLEDWASSVLGIASCEEPIVAIGSSMGGSCAIEMARQAPDRIAALILVGTKAGHRPEPAVRDASIETLRSHDIAGIWPEVSTWFSHATPQEIVDRASTIANQQRTDDLINAVRVFHGRPDLEHVLCQWKKPYLVISGDHDPMFPQHKSERMAKLGPKGELRMMNDCGHFMNMERPEVFNRIVGEFLATVNLDNG